VADRPLKGVIRLSGFLHYSLEYWKKNSRCTEEEVRDLPTDIELEIKRPSTLVQHASFGTWPARYSIDVEYRGHTYAEGLELLGQSGWSAEVITKKSAILGPYNWSVRISVIREASDAARLLILKKDYDGKVIEAIWKRIKDLSRDYEYAEQDNFTEPKHWPNSLYQVPILDTGGENDARVNNSNTYVREIVKRAGLGMKEMSGEHPGRMAPVDPLINYRPSPGGDFLISIGKPKKS
jgi:hypothetical protein